MARKPDLEGARSYLIRLIEGMRSNHQTRLPLMKQMAALAGVSHAVMGEAIAELKHAGTIDVRTRCGITLIADRTGLCLPDLVRNGGFRWHSLKAQLLKELADGRFGRHPLPSQKELAYRYRVAQKTLGKTLRALVDEGILAPDGRKYRLAATAAATPKNTIVLFARGTQTGELAVAHRTAGLFNALEQICMSRSVRLQAVFCHFADTRLTFPGWESGSFTQAFDPTQVLGFMVWQLGLSAEFTSNLVARLQRFRKPTAIFFEEQSALDTLEIPLDGMVRRYTAPADFQAGMTVGNFLISRGHRRVCCWSDSSELQWVTQRLAGIKRAFADAGILDRIDSSYAWTDEYLKGSRNIAAISDCLNRALRRVSQKIEIPVRDGRRADIADNLYYAGFYRELLYHRLEPFMRQALDHMNATAWVGINDTVAMECLHFLRTNKVNVPQQTSVIGFDDSFDAATHRMSSYNFDGAAAMNRVADFILSPKAPIARAETGKPVVVQGFVNERATTGPACTTTSAGTR